MYAQDVQVLDQQKLKTYTYDSLRKSFVSQVHTTPKLGLLYARAYYKKAIENKHRKETYVGARQYALAHNILGQRDSAHHFINIAIQEAKRANNHQEYASCLYVKGNIYYAASLFTKAITYYVKANDIIEKDNDSVKLAILSNSIALVKNQIGETKEALTIVKNNLEFYDKLHQRNDVRLRDTDYINALLNISDIYINLSEKYQEHTIAYLDSATVFCEKGMRKSMQSNDNEAYSMFLVLQGIILQKQGNYQASIVQLANAEKRMMDLEVLNSLPNLYFYQGKNFFLQEDIDTALIYLLKVDSIATTQDSTISFLQENDLLLATCFERKKDIDKALYYLKAFKNKDAQNDEMIRESSQSIYRKYDVPSFTAKIEKLKKQTNSHKHRNFILRTISLLLIGIIIVGLLYYYMQRQRYRQKFEVLINELNETKGKIAKETSVANTKAYKISDANIKKILDGLDFFEKENMFLQPKCSINFLAKEINTNATYLSKTLQSHKGKKFVQYITDLRINYALVQLKEDKKFRAYDVKSIAAELGFNTSESFSKAFKKRTGIYPSFYIKKLNSLDV